MPEEKTEVEEKLSALETEIAHLREKHANDSLAIHPEAAGFVERVTPVKPPKDVYFFGCKCGSIHYRHAGYVKTMVPFMRSGGEKKVSVGNEQVMVCVSCKKAYTWINEQMYDISDKLDVKAWEKTEREMQAMTGPGGEC